MKLHWYLMVFLMFAGLSVQAQTDQDKKEVMQLCLDLPALQSYFHADQSGRLPVIIKNNGKAPQLSITKFEQPVVYMSLEDLEAKGTQTALEFMRFEVTAESATIMFRYNIEELMVTILLKKVKGVWTITDSKLVER